MKSLAGHQAYFFPYIGYFTVLKQADIMVYADCTQYVRKNWMNRNRIIGEDGSVKYVIVPVKSSKLGTSSNEVKIDYSQQWESHILNQLGYYKKRAPYYYDVVDMMQHLFSRRYSSIAELGMESTNAVFSRLGIIKETYKLSELNIQQKGKIKADEWGIEVCKCFPEVDKFVNAPGGKAFYDTSKYDKVNLKINFIQNRLSPYDQKNDKFIPGLSIIDVMMFNSPEEIKKMLGDYDVI